MKTDNELIAEFMEGRVAYVSHGKKDVWVFPFREDEGGSDELLFKVSWDWLMPVVHKILKATEPNGKDGGWSYEYLALEKTRVGNSIEYVYMRVVEFIKNYNQNKP